jgi:hypothetical protein
VLSVLLLAIAAVPTYLYQRARTTSAAGSEPDGARRAVLGALAGFGAVVMVSVVIVAASALASAAFGVAVDPARIESNIASATPGNGPLAAAGVTNVRCAVPGLVRRGDTFTCTERLGDPFGAPLLSTTTTTLLLGPSNAPVVPTTPSTITYTVTVDDDAGAITWRRTTPTTR